MSWVHLEKITKSYGTTQVLREINLEIPAQEQLVIRGASGSGKSTLLYLMGGLDTQSSGEIYVGGKKLSSASDEEMAAYRNKTVGFVFQFHYLLPSMDCMNNILLPAQIGGGANREIKDRSVALAKELGVFHCLQKYPYEISGGEQQRINIIRALSLRPKLLLCDEPTGNLDSKNSEKVTQILKGLAVEFGTTLLIVTHDKKVASQFQREFLIEDGILYGQ